jgi:DNA polymerase III subunit alpha
MKHISFNECNCCFDVNADGGIDIDIDIEKIDLDCPQTWRLIAEGNTKGCFQLESRLGQMMSKKLKPENIEQLSALISIMRPGCLEAYRDGKSVSNHYIDKKNLQEEIDFFHPSLEPILKTTYGEMVYQEQAMQICQHVAEFDLTEADKLRKAIGKKKPEEMMKIKKLFMKKSSSAKIINKDEAEQIFGWIEKSQRYSFNKSHAVSYAYNAYLSAYVKAHFPKHFFASYLKFAKDKMDPLREIQELIGNANQMDIEVYGPSIQQPEKDFFISTKGNICFGLTNVKGVGNSVFEKIKDLLSNIELDNITFIELYYKFLRHINSTAAKALISVGAIDNITISRNRMLFYYDCLNSLTDRELTIAEQFIDKNTEISLILDKLINNDVKKITAKRKNIISSIIKSINNPPYNLDDTPEWIADNEKFHLGTSLTCHKIDGCDIYSANSECKDLNNDKCPKTPIVGAEVSDINVIKTKRGLNPGQEMAFVKIADSTGITDLVIFPEEYIKYKDLLIEGNTVLITLDKSKNRDSYIVKKCWQV